MTKEEILALEPGRELDSLIAIEVLGWHSKRDLVDAYEMCWFNKDNELKARENWSPSTSIYDALQEVEKLEGVWDIRKRYRPHPNDPTCSAGRPIYQAKVQLSDYDPYEDNGLVNKRDGISPWCWSITEAICKAALLVKLQSKLCAEFHQMEGNREIRCHR